MLLQMASIDNIPPMHFSDPSHIPAELRERNQWITWGFRHKTTKIPMTISGGFAKTNNPSTFSSFEEVKHLGKIAYVFQADDPYTGVDLDNCIDENGKLRDWAAPIVSRLIGVGYGEISPSGNGIKFTLRGAKPEGSSCVHKFGDDKQQVEVYDFNRYWAMTGDLYAGSRAIASDEAGQKVVDWICQEYLGAAKEMEPEPETTSLTVDNVTVSARGVSLEGFSAYDYPEMNYDQPSLASDLQARATAYIDSIPTPMNGNRNNTVFSVAGHLRSLVDENDRSLSEQEITDLILGWNRQFVEPLDEREVRQTVRSSGRNGTPRERKPPTAFDDFGEYSTSFVSPALSSDADADELQEWMQGVLDSALQWASVRDKDRHERAILLANMYLFTDEGRRSCIPVEHAEAFVSKWNSALPNPLPADEISFCTKIAGESNPDFVSRLRKNIAQRPPEINEQDIVDGDPDKKIIERYPRMPMHLLMAPGLIETAIEYVTSMQITPQPELAWGGFLAGLATVTGRVAEDASMYGTRTNIYTLGLAESGGGKDGSRKLNKALFEAIAGHSQSRFQGPERLASSAAVNSWVASHPASLFQLDEVGELLKSTCEGKAPPHKRDILAILKHMYTSSDGVYTSDGYADLSKVHDIHNPHACIWGTATPEKAWSAMNPDQVSDGFIGRLFLLLGWNTPPRQVPSTKPAIPQDLIDGFIYWAGKHQTSPRNNLAPPVNTIPFCAGTQAMLDKRYMDIAKAVYKSRDSAERAILNRSTEKIAKLAMLFAISRATLGGKLQIEDCDADLAIAFVDFHSDRLLGMIRENIAENEHELNLNTVYAVIKSFGKKGATTTQVTQKTRKLNGRQRREILDQLIEEGSVCRGKISTSGSKFFAMKTKR
tara:strand:+ start:10613 stop:13264 length:2652 start_codon:yes stop_codon:yes gene_type:complete